LLQGYFSINRRFGNWPEDQDTGFREKNGGETPKQEGEGRYPELSSLRGKSNQTSIFPEQFINNFLLSCGQLTGF
jgi:hypothetical protein